MDADKTSKEGEENFDYTCTEILGEMQHKDENASAKMKKPKEMGRGDIVQSWCPWEAW